MKKVLLALTVLAASLSAACNLLGSTDDGPSGSGDAAIVSFSFLMADNPTLAEDFDASVSGSAVSVAVTHGASVSALKPAIAVSAGASISPASGAVQNFSVPVKYVVTAENGSTREYAVAVSDLGTVTLSGRIRNEESGAGLPGYVVAWNDISGTTGADGAYSLTVPKSRAKAVGTFSYRPASGGGSAEPLRLDLRSDAVRDVSLYSGMGSTRRLYFNLYGRDSAGAAEQVALPASGSPRPWLAVSVVNEAGGTTFGYCYHHRDNTFYFDTPTFGEDCAVYLSVSDNTSGLVLPYSEAGYTQYARMWTGLDLSADGTSIDCYEPADSELRSVMIVPSITGAAGGSVHHFVSFFLETGQGDLQLFNVTPSPSGAGVVVPADLSGRRGYWKHQATVVGGFEMIAMRYSESAPFPSTAEVSLPIDVSGAPRALCSTPTIADGTISTDPVEGAQAYSFFLVDSGGASYSLAALEPRLVLPSWAAGKAFDYLSAAARSPAFPEDAAGARRFYMIAESF